MNKLDTYDLLSEMMTIKNIGNEAVRKARKNNKERGIPNVFSRDGIIYYEMPNGNITKENPFE